VERENRVLGPTCDRLFGSFGAGSVMRTEHEGLTARIQALLETPDAPPVARLRALARQLEEHLGREERVLFPMMVSLISKTGTSPGEVRHGTRRDELGPP